MVRVVGIGPERQHPEERTQDIFSLGDPGDALDVQGVNGEQESYHAAPPASASHATEHNKQHQRAKSVESYVRQVVPTAVETEELTVQHVR